MNSTGIVVLFSIALNNTFTPLDKRHTTQRHTQRHTTNDNNIPIPTYKTMAEVLGAVASAMTVVAVAGQVWSTGWKYYQVRSPPKKFGPQSVVNNLIWG